MAGRRPITFAVLKALRLHQCAKNLLVFVPLVIGGATGNSIAFLSAATCFFALGFLASSAYLINDIVDVADDRRHPTKRSRPLADGSLSVGVAAACSLIGIVIGLAIGTFLNLPAFVALLGYLAFTMAYSWRAKRVPIVDVSFLAGLYTWRIVLGALAAQVALSPWLLVFSFAFFFSLSLAKRHAEIVRMATSDHAKLPGRGYRIADGPFVMTMGVAAGISSILIFVLYLIEGAFHAAFFLSPQVLWVVPVILLLWLCRVWMISGRGEMHDDPIEFAITDRKSLILGAIATVAVLVALLIRFG